ncbi:aggrecan core protein-like [Branchiostoma floridae x Branchiostoma belcheri]
MSATEKKLPPDGGDKTAVDISRLSSGRLHPVPDECLGHEEETVYDYDIPEDVRGYEEDGSVQDKPQEANGNKASGEDESFAYKAKARVIGLWTRLTSSTVIVPAVGCGIVVIASAVAAIILATHLNLVKTEDALGSMMQEDMMIRATLQKLDPSFLTALFDENHTASLEWLEPFENISLNSKTLPVTVTSLPTTGKKCLYEVLNLNECTRNPCLHGRCVNKDGGYNCACNPGWTGQNCHLAKPCPAGWRGYENHCYRLMRDKVKWGKAKKRCEQLGANLASITSYGEANFVNTIITGAPVGKWGIYLVWFGLHRNYGFRKFTDGSQVFYTNWEPGQPNNKRDIWAGQNCVGMYSKTGMGCGGHLFAFDHVKKGRRNDDQCYRHYPFICKRPK